MKRSLVIRGRGCAVAGGPGPRLVGGGHASVAEAAAAGLPDDMPAFFRAGGKALGHFAGDPDRWKNRSCKFLRAAESPDHFLDLEDFEGKPLPGRPLRRRSSCCRS